MLSIIMLIFLSAIAYQDIRSRSVTWILFLAAAGINSVIGAERISTETLVVYTLVNMSVIGFNIVLLVAYLWVRYRKGIRSLFLEYLGLGDLLFWIAVAPAFSPLNYILFHCASLLASFIAFMLYRSFAGDRNMTVPLAGLQAIFYSGLLLALLLGWEYNVYDDLNLLFNI